MKNQWLDDYINLHKEIDGDIQSSMGIPASYSGLSESTSQSPLLPLAMKVSAKTIGLDLVSVMPIGGMVPGKSKAQQLREDRINKLRKIEGKEPDVKLKNDTEVPQGPIGKLLYVDFQYGDNSGITQNNI